MNETCTSGKIGYATEGKAQAAVRSITSRGGIRRARARQTRDRSALGAYRCAECDAWHLGSA